MQPAFLVKMIPHVLGPRPKFQNQKFELPVTSYQLIQMYSDLLHRNHIHFLGVATLISETNLTGVSLCATVLLLLLDGTHCIVNPTKHLLVHTWALVNQQLVFVSQCWLMILKAMQIPGVVVLVPTVRVFRIVLERLCSQTSQILSGVNTIMIMDMCCAKLLKILKCSWT